MNITPPERVPHRGTYYVEAMAYENILFDLTILDDKHQKLVAEHSKLVAAHEDLVCLHNELLDRTRPTTKDEAAVNIPLSDRVPSAPSSTWPQSCPICGAATTWKISGRGRHYGQVCSAHDFVSIRPNPILGPIQASKRTFWQRILNISANK